MEPPLHEGDDRHDLGVQIEFRIDATEFAPQRLRVEEPCDRRFDERVLVTEGAEDRPLRDAGGLGDLLRGHFETLLRQEWDDGVDDGGLPFLDRERARTTAGRRGPRYGLHVENRN